jgi:guanylate kinase
VLTLPRIGVVAICGPTCAGKSTLQRALLDTDPMFVPVVSTTTRPSRAREDVIGAYRFLSAFQFAEQLERGQMIECDEVSGHLYGLERRAVRGVLSQPPRVGVAIVTPNGLAPLRGVCAEYGRGLYAVYLDSPPAVLLARLLRRYHDEPVERTDHYAARALHLLGTHGSWKDAYAYDLVLAAAGDAPDDIVEQIRSAVRAGRMVRHGQSVVHAH